MEFWINNSKIKAFFFSYVKQLSVMDSIQQDTRYL